MKTVIQTYTAMVLLNAITAKRGPLKLTDPEDGKNCEKPQETLVGDLAEIRTAS